MKLSRCRRQWPTSARTQMWSLKWRHISRVSSTNSRCSNEALVMANKRSTPTNSRRTERIVNIMLTRFELQCVLACLEAGGDRHGFKQLGEKLSKVKQES